MSQSVSRRTAALTDACVPGPHTVRDRDGSERDGLSSREVVALVQQRQVQPFGGRVSEEIAEIQHRRRPAPAFAELEQRLAQPQVIVRQNRCNLEPKGGTLGVQLVQCRGATATQQHQRCLRQRGNRNDGVAVQQRCNEAVALRLMQKNRQQRRAVDDDPHDLGAPVYLGAPISSYRSSSKS